MEVAAVAMELASTQGHMVAEVEAGATWLIVRQSAAMGDKAQFASSGDQIGRSPIPTLETFNS